jgi:hypothetical protein
MDEGCPGGGEGGFSLAFGAAERVCHA